MSDKIAASLSLGGDTFRGYSFGAPVCAAGEAVFSSAMTGYPETLTDPAYAGQILVLTYPLIGNYGIPSDERDTLGLLRFFESERAQIAALVVSDYSHEYSHWNAVRSLSDWLQAQGVPAIYGVDTREITRLIREKGTMPATLEVAGAKVSTREIAPDITAPVEYGDGAPKIALVDCLCTNSTIRELVKRGAKVTRVPADYDFNTLACDGIVIGGGGDPTQYKGVVERIGRIDKPLLAIGTGHLLLAQAAGAKLARLPFGHHGHNIPVQEVGSSKGLISAQAHLFAVDTATLPKGWAPYYTNLNDGTCEGIIHESGKQSGIQFTPSDVHYDNFIALCRQ